MSAVAGLLSANMGTYGGTGAQDLVGEFQETIFVRNSKGLNVGSTLFGLMSKLKTEPSDNIEFNWFERNPVRRTVYTNGGNLLNNSTLLTFDDSNGNSVNAVLNNSMVLRNKRTGEYIRINNGTNDPDPTVSTVTVQRDLVGSGPGSMGGVGTPSGTGAAIQDNDEWTIITTGKDEGSDPVRGAYENPDSLSNYIQTFNSTVWLTNAFKGQVLRTDIEGPLTDRRIQALEKISRDIEFAFLMGRKKCLQGSSGYLYYTGGIYDSIIAAQLASSNILDGSGNSPAWAGSSALSDPQGFGTSDGKCTLATFNQWLENFMTYGSDAKLAFCGPLAYSAISTFANSASNGYRIMQGETVFGMHITTINTPFGELSLAFHPLLKESPALNSWMFVVDLPLLVQKTFEPLFLEPDIQIPGQDTYKEQYRAKLGLKLKFANAFGVAHDLTSIVAS